MLAASEAQSGRVLPVYVSAGLAWEAAERQMVAALLEAAVFAGRVEPLVALDLTMRDIYPPAHWAIRGLPPAYDTPDEAVYLAGRNVTLLAKAAVLAATRRIPRVALGLLAGNPFPDATPAFLDAMRHALSLGLQHAIAIATPLAAMRKAEVIALGARLGVPFEHTLSCMNPVPGNPPRHCGLCSKCRERRDAFAAAGWADPAPYAFASPR